MQSYLSLLRQRHFLALYLGLTLSRLGDGLAELAITWSVWKSTDSPAMVALALLLQTLPRTVLPFFAGVVADRQRPRQIMLATDLVRLAVTLLAAAAGWQGRLGPWELMAVGLLLTCASTFFGPARAALMPRLLVPEELPAANGLMSGTFLSAHLVGSLLGGLLFPFVGAAGLIGLDAVTFAVSALALLALPPGEPAGSKAAFASEVREGLATVWQAPALRRVVATFAVGTLLAGGAVAVGKTMLVDRFGVGAPGLGLLSTAMALGLVAGSLVAGRARFANPARTVMLAWAAEGVLLVLLGLSPTLLAALAVSFASGIVTAFINVPTESLIQLHGGAHTGKVYSYWVITIWLGESLSLAAAGPLYAMLPPAGVFGALGVTLLALGLLAAWEARVARPRYNVTP